MNSDLQNLTVRYLEAREAVKSVFRMESEYSFPAAANLYVVANALVDTERLTDCKRLVRDEAGIFSNFRGSILVPLAAKLALSDDPKARWDRAAANYAVLKEQFLRSEYLALAALLLTDSAQDADVPALAARGKALYRRMKDEHPFLTGQEDSVFAVLLAQSQRSDDELIADMEECYRILDERFPKGDGLQSASHVLALSPKTPEEKVRRMIALFDGIQNAGGKYGKDRQLPILAALSLGTASEEELVRGIMDLDGLLAQQKGYKGVFGLDRRTRMMHAAMLLSLPDRQMEVVNAAAQQATLAMIAAQQALLCAVVASSAASSAAASNASH